MSIRLPGFRLGIVGGGQLGRMMAVEARRLGVFTTVLDPSPYPPAAGIADVCLQGSLHDPVALRHLASCSDVVTYEIEHIDTSALVDLEGEGTIFLPRPSVLAHIQDKLVQKDILLEQGIPLPAFQGVAAHQVDGFEPARWPVVQKLRKGGYDGRGVTVLRSPADPRLQGDSLFEDLVDIKAELAVLVARDTTGQYAVYPVVEMVFDPHAQICSSVLAPARVPAIVADRAIEVALAAVEALGGVGILAVELFWAADGSILVNEIAPRPHNSGHWTIEGAVTNQFAQHVRAVCGLPLGATDLVRPSLMVNLLGDKGASGSPVIHGADQALAIPGLHLHWYQKTEVKELRKMGHYTITAPTVDGVLALGTQAQTLLGVGGTGTTTPARTIPGGCP